MSEPGRAVSWVSVVGGAVIGWIGSWLLFAVVLIALYGSGGNGGDQTVQLLVAVGALLVVPALSAGVLLSRGRKDLGHGLLMGVAIGSIVGSGVCAVSVFPGW